MMDTYIFEFNKEIFDFLQKVVESPGKYNPVYIFGKPGSGKSTIIRSIFKPGEDVLLLKPSELADLTFPLKEEYRYVIILDIDLVSFNDDWVKKFFIQFQDWIDAGTQVIVTGSQPPDKLDIPERVLSGIRGGVSMGIRKLMRKDREEIVSKMFPDLSEDIRDSAIQSRSETIRELIGYIKSMEIGGGAEEKTEAHLEGEQFRDLVKSLEEDMPSITQERSIEEELREEYRAKLYVWEMKGFNCERLKKVIDGPIEDITREFVSFTTDVQRLVELQRRYGLIDPALLTDEERKEIETDLFNPDKILELDRRIGELEKRSELKTNFSRYLDWEKGLDSLVSGKGNQDVLSFIKDFVEKKIEWAGVYGIVGKRGYGKTHHLNAIAVELFRNHPQVIVGYAGLPSLIQNPEGMLATLSECDIILLDDVDRISTKGGVDLKPFFKKNSNKCIIFTSTRSPEGITGLDIPDNRLFVLDEPDIEVKKAMLKVIIEMGDYSKDVDYEEGLEKVKGGFYEVEFYANTKSRRVVVEEAEEEIPSEEKVEEIEEEVVEEVKEVEEVGEVEQVVEEQLSLEEPVEKIEEEAEEKAVEEEKVEEPEKTKVSEPPEEIKGEVSKIEGYDINIENVNLRITKEL
ncbi:hypothetical protein DRQ23_00220 [bacterium]|nr:MAG: hypothetical protein DRQ23_00220 [bacterium]